MDKRKILRSLIIPLQDGRKIPVTVYARTSGRSLSARLCYGEVACYALPWHTDRQIVELVRRAVKKREDFHLDRPFYVPGESMFLLGKRLPVVHGKDDGREAFFVRSNCKDPIVPYKARFLDYLSKRVPELAKTMGLDVSSFRYRTGLFLTYYGCCFPTRKQIKFDYRLFAYRPEIIDSVIIHELTHLYEKGHNERFYKILHLYCPDYDRLQGLLVRGDFEGERL